MKTTVHFEPHYKEPGDRFWLKLTPYTIYGDADLAADAILNLRPEWAGNSFRVVKVITTTEIVSKPKPKVKPESKGKKVKR